MRITESKLRRIIRSVIKESEQDFDSYDARKNYYFNLVNQVNQVNDYLILRFRRGSLYIELDKNNKKISELDQTDRELLESDINEKADTYFKLHGYERPNGDFVEYIKDIIKRHLF